MTESFIQQEREQQKKRQQQQRQEQQQYRQENRSESISATETVKSNDDRRNKRPLFSHRLVVPSPDARQESLVESTISTNIVSSSLPTSTKYDVPNNEKNRDVAGVDGELFHALLFFFLFFLKLNSS